MRRREVIAGILAGMGANPAHGQPALDELRSDARKAGFDLSHAELAAIQTYVSDFQSAAERVANAIPPAPAPKYGPRNSTRPLASENPLNAWYVTASIKGAATGPLAGKKIAIKDN